MWQHHTALLWALEDLALTICMQQQQGVPGACPRARAPPAAPAAPAGACFNPFTTVPASTLLLMQNCLQAEHGEGGDATVAELCDVLAKLGKWDQLLAATQIRGERSAGTCCVLLAPRLLLGLLPCVHSPEYCIPRTARQGAKPTSCQRSLSVTLTLASHERAACCQPLRCAP